MAKTPLDVQDLKSCFFTRRGVVKAVGRITSSLDAGETVRLAGESGCGKTIVLCA